MPKYDAKCPKCGAVHEYIRRVSACMDTPECCGVRTEKVILTAPMGVVRGRFEPFKSPVDGSIISSTREMAEHNKRNNVVSLADGYTDEVVRSGNFGEKPKADPEDLKQDVVESFKMVSSGYTPERRSEDAA